MITGRQCRAARALIGWTQGELGERCGLSKTAVNNFETGNASIKQTTAEGIKRACEMKSIEFLPNEGVCFNQNKCRILRGDTALLDLWDDILDSFGDQSGEILLKNVDESITFNEYGDALKTYIQKLKDNNITERILVKEGTSVLAAPKEWYRQIPEDFFDYGTTTFIYKDKVAFRLRKDKTIILIENENTAQAETESFNRTWNIATPIRG